MKRPPTRILTLALWFAAGLICLGAATGCGSLDSSNDSERAWGESDGFNFKPSSRENR